MRSPLSLALLVFLACDPRAEGEANVTARTSTDAPRARSIVEIRSYNLRPGTRAEFHRIAVTEAVPLLRKFNMDVVGLGPSPHDTTSYVLIRAFASLEARQREEEAFYSSDDWRNGPRASILAPIENYTSIVLDLDAATVDSLRMALRR